MIESPAPNARNRASRRAWKIRVGTAFAALLCAGAAWFIGIGFGNRVEEPLLGGVPASFHAPSWVKRVVQIPPAVAAGAEHVPWLLTELDRDDSPAHAFLLRHKDGLPGFVRRRVPEPFPGDLRRALLRDLIRGGWRSGRIRLRDMGKTFPRIRPATAASLVREFREETSPTRFGPKPSVTADDAAILAEWMRTGEAEVRMASAVTLLCIVESGSGDFARFQDEAIGAVRRVAGETGGHPADWRALARVAVRRREVGARLAGEFERAHGRMTGMAAGAAMCVAWLHGPDRSHPERVVDGLVRFGDGARTAYVLNEMASMRLGLQLGSRELAESVWRLLESPAAIADPEPGSAVSMSMIENGDDPPLPAAVAALRVLAHSRAQAPDRLGILNRFLADPDRRVRIAAATALEQAGGGVLLPLDETLRGAFQDAATSARMLSWVKSCGTNASQFLPVIQGLLGHEDRTIRESAYGAAVKVAPGSDELWPVMRIGLRDPAAQSVVLGALPAWGRRVGELREELRELARDPSSAAGMEELRRAAQRLLDGLGAP